MTIQTSSPLFLGLSGIQLPVPKYDFPPEHQSSSRLTYYSTFFNSIEINNSFYKIPLKKTLERWAGSVSQNFTFTFKLFREITHSKDLTFRRSHVVEFIETISAIGNKCGCLLVQFPPSLLSHNLHQLEILLEEISMADTANCWKIAVEFRNKGWYNTDVYDLLEHHHATMVLQDIPASATPTGAVFSDLIYVRFHGPTGNYRGTYAEAFLAEYASYIREWLAEKKRVYVYFNNTAGDAFNNCRTLQRLVNRT